MKWIAKSPKGKILDLTCRHAACQVRYEDAHRFVCPCHGAEYDLEGRVLKGPAKEDLVVLENYGGRIDMDLSITDDPSIEYDKTYLM
jgi:Rieske Fe-S protein